MKARHETETETKPLVVDMTFGSPVLKKVPETLLVVEAGTHETAKEFVRSVVDPKELQPGTNFRRAEPSRKWWVFGVFL